MAYNNNLKISILCYLIEARITKCRCAKEIKTAGKQDNKLRFRPLKNILQNSLCNSLLNEFKGHFWKLLFKAETKKKFSELTKSSEFFNYSN